MTRITWLLNGLGSVALAACATVTPASSRSAADHHVPLEPYLRELMTVSAQVGTQPLRFLFDTGAGLTLITPTVARQLGCEPYGREVGHRMNGDAVEFQWCDPQDLRIGVSFVRHRDRIAVFDVNVLLPPSLPRLDGVLALDSFRERMITLDWKDRLLTVHGSGSAPTVSRARPSVRFATGDTGASLTVLLEVSGSRGPLWFLLDSGNLRGTLIGSHVVRDGLLSIAADTSIALRLGSGRTARFTTIADAISYDGVLGTDFLLAEPVTLDLRSPPN